MKIALGLAVALACGGSAFAAERAPTSPASECQPLEKFKAVFDAKTKFVAATIGEYHVLKGVYISQPKTPEGNPPGDGALLITHESPRTMVVWTRDNGKQVCGALNTVLMIPSAVMALIGHTETGKGETKDADDSKDELHL